MNKMSRISKQRGILQISALSNHQKKYNVDALFRVYCLMSMSSMFIFCSCHSKQHILLEKYPNGMIKKDRDYVDNGVYYEREYYESGAVNVIKKFEDGLQDSIQTVYDESGNKRAQLFFKKGLKNGIVREIYQSGQTLFEGKCNNGKFEGKVVWYYRDGKMREEGYRHLDIDTGTWLYYDTAGKIVKQIVK